MRWLAIALLLGVVGCGHPPAPGTATSAAPRAPWRVNYSNGVGNVYTLWNDGTEAVVAYQPVGWPWDPPEQGLLSPEEIETLWTRVVELEARLDGRVAERAERSVRFQLTDPSAGERSFMLAPSPAVAAFDQFLAGLHVRPKKR